MVALEPLQPLDRVVVVVVVAAVVVEGQAEPYEMPSPKNLCLLAFHPEDQIAAAAKESVALAVQERATFVAKAWVKRVPVLAEVVAHSSFRNPFLLIYRLPLAVLGELELGIFLEV
jgi:hypothetical protein